MASEVFADHTAKVIISCWSTGGKEGGLELKVIFRSPKYPVIIISRDRLFTGGNHKSIAKALSLASPLDDKKVIQMIDSTGEEFCFHLDLEVLSPGFRFSRWTKKEIIALYNSYQSKHSDQTYPLKSLSNKRLANIVTEICHLIKIIKPANTS